MTLQVEKERDLVRELARRVAEIAQSAENERVKRRWRDVNALRKPDRAPVWCHPVGAWAELLPEGELVCGDPSLRNYEREFRRTLIKKEIDDDSPLESRFSVGAAFDCAPANTYGVDIKHDEPEEEGGAWIYDPPLKSEDDLAKLVLPTFTYNPAKTAERLSKAQDLLGDIMPVELVCGPPLGGTICSPAAALVGLTPMMLNLAIAPQMMHRLMGYLRDATLRGINAVEASGLLTPNNHGPMTCSDPIGVPVNGQVSCKNLWMMANSQEFDQVSPKMWEEFLLNYQRPIFERFGLVGYGCCENLTHKMEQVLSIPNLRIFVCSAWTDLNKLLGRVGTDYVIMWRQKASDVVFPDDAAKIRLDLEEGARSLQGSHYQIVLRELQTLSGHPDRLHVWTQCAKEAAAKYA